MPMSWPIWDAAHPWLGWVQFWSWILMLSEGLMVLGRLRHSSLRFQAKCPVILPPNQPVSWMIILNIHSGPHLRVEWTLVQVRSKFWTVGARNMIKSIKRSCVVCRKLYASTVEQNMTDLPPVICELYKPPFTYTGYDIFGPFYVLTALLHWMTDWPMICYIPSCESVKMSSTDVHSQNQLMTQMTTYP